MSRIIVHLPGKHLVFFGKISSFEYFDFELGLRFWEDLQNKGRYGITLYLMFFTFIVSMENCN